MTAERRLRVTLLTLGSRGDVEPYLGLGVALARAGHAVTVAVSAGFERLARRAGLQTLAVEPDPRLTADDGGPPLWLRPSAVEGVIRLRRAARQASRPSGAYSGYLEAGRGADVVLYPALLAPIARTIGHRYGCALIPAYLAPLHPTRAFPSPYLNLPLRPSWNRTSHLLALRLSKAAMAGLPSSWRTPIPGGAPASLDPIPPRSEICLYGFSRHVLPPPPDWPPGVVVTGRWWFDASPDWRPPEELDRFLRAPGKVVFIGFGSMMDPRPAHLKATVETALTRLGCRAILLTGPCQQLDLPRSPRWSGVEDIPLDWLFRRVDAVVCHGGAGTVAQAARAGKPVVTIPFFGDQHFWGVQIHRAAGGPPPIPRRALTTQRLVSALEMALEDSDGRERAARLGARVRSEDGLATAVRLIEARLGV